MDQRKVNVLAREYAGKLGVEHKPVILSHHMLMGLLEGQEKMSKSVAGSAIFMEDTAGRGPCSVARTVSRHLHRRPA